MHLAVLVACGGALGSALRYWLGSWLTAGDKLYLPYGLLAINIIGSFFMGVGAAFIRLKTNFMPAESLAAFFLYGFCGGFTSFSAFSWQIFNMLDCAQYLRASVNIIAAVTLSVSALALGWGLVAKGIKIFN